MCALWPKLEAQLEQAGLKKSFKSVEMRSLMSLSRMELNGVGFSAEVSDRQRRLMQRRMSQLEEEAYRLAGHPFSLTSPDEICQVMAKADWDLL